MNVALATRKLNVDGKGRHIFLLPEHQQKIQTKVRKEQKTDQWRRRYAIRAGCEATVSETVHARGLRRCRYRGLAKTHVQHVLTAAGTNIIRL
ncbi:transposase [Streptomyces pathocidini]|uniref:Transposase n=1 Tax=Streptomyces pathocidini TaxID=1650571 RepID=A0ABW7UXX7_9ACTN|nr:transposase [Streptomyces pathocidini]